MLSSRTALAAAVLLAVLALPSVTTPVAAEEGSRERVVPSPYTVIDYTGENRHADITAFQVRLAPHYLELQFRMLHYPAHEQPPASFWFAIDVQGTRHHPTVVVTPSAHRLQVLEGLAQTCASRNVIDLGTNQWGHGFSARVRYPCIDNPRALRVQMHASCQYCNDVAPNDGYTPFIGSPV